MDEPVETREHFEEAIADTGRGLVSSYYLNSMHELDDVDAVANILLQFRDRVSEVRVKVGDLVELVHPVSPPNQFVVLPWWTPEYPFLGCGRTEQHPFVVTPAPHNVRMLGIVYPASIRYQLHSAPHVFPLCDGDGKCCGHLECGPGMNMKYHGPNGDSMGSP